jgi:hypothetical protein
LGGAGDPLRRGERITHPREHPRYAVAKPPVAQRDFEVGDVVAVLRRLLLNLVERVERLVLQRVGDLADQLGF